MSLDVTLYFRHGRDFDRAMEKRDLGGALTSAKQGLRIVPAAVRSMRRDGPLPPTILFVHDGVGTLAALAGDLEVFNLMDAVNSSKVLKQEIDVPRYRREMEVIQLVRDHLLEVKQTTLPELRELFSAEDSARLPRLTNWMDRWGELSKERVGNVTTLSAGKPEQKFDEVPPPFRSGMALQTTPLLRFRHRPAGKGGHNSYAVSERDLYGSQYPIFSDTKIAERRLLPATHRQPFVMSTRTTRDGSWLLSESKRQPDGTHLTYVSRYRLDGSRVEPLVLPHAVEHSYTGPTRPEIITIDRALNLRVYGFDGKMLVGFALSETPEVRWLRDDFESEGREIRLRVVDVSWEHSCVTIAYAEYCWVFKIDGTPVAAFRLPAVPGTGPLLLDEVPEVDLKTALVAQGLPSDSSLRDMAEWLDSEDIMPRALRPFGFVSVATRAPSDDKEREDAEGLFADIGGVTELDAIVRTVGGLQVDWIRYIHLSDDGESIWVSTYSGLLARVSLTMEVMNSWLLPGAIDNVWEVAGRTFICIGATVAELIPGEVNPPFWIGSRSGTVIGGRIIADRHLRTLTIGEVLTGATKSIALRRNFRAIYPTETGVRVETTTTYVDVEI